MDMTGFKFGKPEPRIYQQKARKLDANAQERLCRALVKRRDHGKCIVPGCKETYAHMHHIVFRSQSKAKRTFGGWMRKHELLTGKVNERWIVVGTVYWSLPNSAELLIDARAAMHFDRVA